MSWYPSTKINTQQLQYLQMIQKIWFVMDTRRKWVPYTLQPHQVHWHSRDVACLMENAKSRVVFKSRNTSFTVSSIISNLMAVPFFSEVVVPFVRLNKERALDLIDDTKKHIRHMRPIRLPNGRLYPFDPAKVNMSKAGSIRFDNGVEFRAFPATSSSSEIIRGLRIVGSAGIVDEANFMRDYENIYIALRDTTAGTNEEGEDIFQMNIGTTLKGSSTPFKIWLDKQIKFGNESLEFYDWPVFDKRYFNIDIPIDEQNVEPIVKWHSLDILENKRKENKKRFKEEYMSETVDADDAYYPNGMIINSINTELENGYYDEKEIYYLGVDIASVHDYFSISIFAKYFIKEIKLKYGTIRLYRYIQRALYYKRQILLPDAQKKVDYYINKYKPIKSRIDQVGIGLQITQAMQSKYGKSAVQGVSGGSTIKDLKNKKNIKINDYLHSNQKTLFTNNYIELLNDELQIQHYGMVTEATNNSIVLESNELGHGDIVMSNGYALLPDNLKVLSNNTSVKTSSDTDKDSLPLEKVKEKVKIYSKQTLKNKIKFMRSNRK